MGEKECPRETIVEKNITSSFEFERYILEHSEVLEQIPDGERVLTPRLATLSSLRPTAA